jgi:large subunit ribosomal protein L21
MCPIPTNFVGATHASPAFLELHQPSEVSGDACVAPTEATCDRPVEFFTPIHAANLTSCGHRRYFPLFRSSGEYMYAVIDQNSKQYKVSVGDTIRLDTPYVEGVKTMTFDRILLVGGEGDAKIGAPVVAGATVEAQVLGETLGKKVVTVKYARRKGYHKKKGHRQAYTEVRITAINA